MTLPELIKARLDAGRTIADADVRKMVEMCERQQDSLYNISQLPHCGAEPGKWECDCAYEIKKIAIEALATGGGKGE